MPQRGEIIQGNRLLFAKGSDGRAAQRRNVPDRTQRQRQVARQAAHVGAFSGGNLEVGMVGVGLAEQSDMLDAHASGLQPYRLVGAGERIGAPPAHLDRGKDGRHLVDVAGESRERLQNIICGGADVALRRHLALGVVRGPRLAPADGKAIDLGAADGIGDRLGGLAQGHGKNAGGLGIQGAAVSGLGGAGEGAHLADNGAGRDARRLVDDQPAVDRPAAPPTPHGSPRPRPDPPPGRGRPRDRATGCRCGAPRQTTCRRET